MAARARPGQLGGIVLTGGAGARLGRTDKAAVVLGGRTLLDTALEALAEVPEVVVVGARRATERPVVWTREHPAGGGPAAGLLAGLARFGQPPDWVVVLAVDMPLVSAGTVRRLCESAARDGALLVDDGGSEQYLCAVYRSRALRDAAPDRPTGVSMRGLVGALDLVEVPAEGDESTDVDTVEHLARLRERFDG